MDDAIAQDRHVSIIQLDVEFHELEVLRGALATISRCRPILILETVPDDPWFADNILALGYRQDRMLHANTVFVAEPVGG